MYFTYYTRYTCGTCYTYYIWHIHLTYDTVIRIVLIIPMPITLIIPTVCVVLFVISLLVLLHTNLTYNLQHVGSPFCSKTLHPTPETKKKKQSAPLTRLGMKSSLLGQTCAHWLLPRLLGGEHPMAHDIVEKTMGDRFRPRIGGCGTSSK